MANIGNQYESLSTRAGFNAAVRHIKGAIALIEELAPNVNFADAARERENSGVLDETRLSTLLYMVLVDKLGYRTASRNLNSIAEALEPLAADFAAWNAVDLVIAYHHPDLGLIVANPKSGEQMASVGALRKHELLVVYAGHLDKGGDASCDSAAALALDLLEGRRPSIPSALLSGAFKSKTTKAAAPVAEKAAAPKKATTRGAAKAAAEPAPTAPAPAAVPAAKPVVPVAGKSRMTPMYSVVVSNELFHNGNVEAWKRIIASFKTAHPGLEVNVYYDGERIININSLFKWGKVKHGSSIQFAVAGTDIKDVAKLQRYFAQGASSMFESFLHGPVNTPLKLF